MKKGIVLLCFVGSLLAFWGCSKYRVGKFVMPTWDTQFSAPIFNRTYTLGEILYKDSVKVFDGDTTHIYTTPPIDAFTISGFKQISGVQIGTDLGINAVPPVTQTQTLTNFKIDANDSLNYTVANPVPSGTTGPVPAIPPTTTSLSPDHFFTNYNSATLSNGLLHISITNGYPATINFDSGSVNLLDASGNPLPVFGHPLSLAPNGGRFDTVLNITGRTLSSHPQISLTYNSPGGGTSTYQSNNLLNIFVGFLDLRVSSANAIIPPQNPIIINQAIVLVDLNKFIKADIQSGSFTLSMRNDLPLTLPVQIVFRSLTRQNNPNDTLRVNYTLQASSSMDNITIPLNGYELNTADSRGNPSDSIHYTATFQIPGSNGNFVNISTSQTVRATFSMSDLVLNSFTGEAHLKGPLTLANDTQKINLGDLKSKFHGGITFLGDSTKLNLQMTSVGFPYLAHISMKPGSAEYPSLLSDSIVVDTVIYPGKVNTIAVGREFANALNSFAVRTNTLPDEFFINGYVIVNPGPTVPYLSSYSIGTIKSTDSVSGTNLILMPFYLGILNSSYVDTTTKPVFDSSTSAKMSNVDTAAIVFEIKNGVPLQLSLRTQFIDTLTDSVTQFDSIVVQAPPAADFNQDGTVIAPQFSKSTISLMSNQAKLFGRSYMRFDYNFSTPLGSTPVPFTKNNTISLKVYGNFHFRVDKNTFK
ncbi:MAG TPA: hypothetical protein VLX91_03095 [Candidatus Acidoferrales bacterium]|nr:hypothetical protein [Candidatus Acidoferrales bacterium]